MSAIESLFLAMYPLWPKVLLPKFASLLSLEVAKVNPGINPEIINTYNQLNGDKKINISPYADTENALLSPTNPRYIRKEYYDAMLISFSASTVGTHPNELPEFMHGMIPSNNHRYLGKVIFDYRIFSNVIIYISFDYTPFDYQYNTSFLTLQMYAAQAVLNVKSVLNAYSGAMTVQAMIENGVPVDVDKDLLTEFVTFINAYSKYGGELAAANGLQAEKNRQALTDYKNSISEKLASRKNELSDLKTQISFAAKNETNSAKRDMQNLSLSAQSLMIQLQDKLK